MTHKLYTSEEAARSVLAALRYLTVLPRTVRMDFSSEFVAGRGQTVNVRGPISAGEAKTYTAENRTSRDAIEFNDLTQSWVPVKLDNQVYNAVRLPDDWATFTLKDLQSQVIRPQAESVVDALAKPLLAEMGKIKAEKTAAATVDQDTGESDVLRSITRLRAVLNERKVPMVGRTLAIGSDWEEALQNTPMLNKVNESGDDGSMLREATLGRIKGFDVVFDASLPKNKAIAYHKDAFAFVTRPSRVPEGAAYGAVVSEAGFSLRHIMHYNADQIEDQSVIDTFHGAATLDANRAVAAEISTSKPGLGG
ncbi:P22 phage major capsid protein family protein [Trueperella pyogenes]|uniref:P22 phage major capsid protein family protein n=1 Tax=Trueperella pyogenes TaxID=1661 RepID=UPI00345DA8CA